MVDGERKNANNDDFREGVCVYVMCFTVSALGGCVYVLAYKGSTQKEKQKPCLPFFYC